MSIRVTPSAFASLCGDHIVVSGSRASRSFRFSFNACIIDDGYADILSDNGTSSRIRQLTFMIPRVGDGAWIDSRIIPQIGDSISCAEGDFEVYSSELLNSCFYALGARKK